jgi:putative alpha-1,2-mannosidase
MKKSLILLSILIMAAGCCKTKEQTTMVEHPIEYVSTLVGTLSDGSFSTGNTYPATARPWGMNF